MTNIFPQEINTRNQIKNEEENINSKNETYEFYKFDFNQSEKLYIYEQRRKDPTTTRMLSFYFPGAGHAYVGKYGKSLLFIGGTVASSYIAFSDKAYNVFGFGGIVILKMFEIINSGSEANRYNTQLRKNLFGVTTSRLTFNCKSSLNYPQLSLSVNF